VAKRRERCRFCGGLFVPDPRLKGRQYACRKPECQRERHRENCAQWNEAHCDQFRDRYPQTRAWLKARPGYIAQYRAGHPEAREKHRRDEQERRRRRRAAAVDIQDALSMQALADQEVESATGRVDIQDSLWSYLFSARGLTTDKARVDIQDSMASPLPRPYSSAKEIRQCAECERERQGL